MTLDSVESTQDEARARLDDRPFDRPGAVLVVAAKQTRGRGRSGQGWVDAPRALAASLAFRPTWPTDAWSRMTLAAGLAAVDAVAEATAIEVALKWPNDVVGPDHWEGGGDVKLGGILTESSGAVVVAGLGLNLHWPDAPAGIGGLLAADPGPGLAAVIARAWADRVLERVGGQPDAWGVDEYRRRCVTLGADVTWEPGGSGRAVDVDPDGRLEVETAAGLVRLAAGEVRQVRPAKRISGQC